MERLMQNMILNPDPADGSKPTDSEFTDILEDVSAEYQNLDSTLDELNAHLDVMEQRNDDLVAKFQDLLESSRQTRQEFQAMRCTSDDAGESGQGSADRAGPLENVNSEDNLQSDSAGSS